MCLECIGTDINLSYSLKANTFIFFTEFPYVESKDFDFAGTSSTQRLRCSEIICAAGNFLIYITENRCSGRKFFSKWILHAL